MSIQQICMIMVNNIYKYINIYFILNKKKMFYQILFKMENVLKSL